jgi:ParB-like chromosome segregation protein Spo0J
MIEPTLKYISTSDVSESSFETPTQNKKESFKELKTHIDGEGVLQTLLVRELENTFEVVDGNRRLKAAQELGLEEIPCAIISIDREKAIALSMTLNRLQGGIDPTQAAQMFRNLIQEGFTREEIKELIPEDLYRQIDLLLKVVDLEDKEPLEGSETDLSEEDKADVEEHASVGPFHKQFQFKEKNHREEVDDRIENEQREGEQKAYTLLRLLRSLDSSKTRTHEEENQ